jgi:hypothetical protein
VASIYMVGLLVASTTWLAACTLLTPPNTKAFRWLSIKSRVKGFLRVCIRQH